MEYYKVIDDNGDVRKLICSKDEKFASDPKIHKDMTNFGFTYVAANKKSLMIRELFDDVAPNYDLMNDLMSFGIHRIWKQAFVDLLAPRQAHWLLDVAGGTGDIANLWQKRGGGRVTVCDINAKMIAVGQNRMKKNNSNIMDWIVGNAEHLPLGEGLVDRVTIAFGLRNVTDIDSALAEMTRVLRRGGRFMCLEFSQPSQKLFNSIYDIYSFRVLPWLGEQIAHNRAAYNYLIESIRQFPNQHDLATRMSRVGLEHVQWRNLSGGIVAIHSGWRF
ncbi:ubiquinone/menaquinone biosynthesis methyltransferases family protein [Candidatus Endolissoclinum faulkneri L2]|uniref:Ubiquinone/menaquinone biosynthesis C-methyltransferase UbiE n=1 Tax=Candidatus Endolissoclinum faulkneri L2 TaxID=1193729 RepID=K7YHE3_9PROT|nr:bifunctional demethylmenaquinone methyltransferase/2-methoxy-6-polyprenyl-1,4-benzoquinol methylase UbiE [Candidatus Endolissoclinum faulkneri]AFX98960.1 ubiquinone/menaquinone biosynthesis methyltransferases family protein [Candidatus Endolissoclinum faulkneri L2]